MKSPCDGERPRDSDSSSCRSESGPVLRQDARRSGAELAARPKTLAPQRGRGGQQHALSRTLTGIEITRSCEDNQNLLAICRSSGTRFLTKTAERKNQVHR